MRCGMCRKPPADQETCTDYPCGLRTGRLEAGFADAGFAEGYDGGWRDAKAGRPYGSTPAGQRTERFVRLQELPSEDDGSPETVHIGGKGQLLQGDR